MFTGEGFQGLLHRGGIESEKPGSYGGRHASRRAAQGVEQNDRNRHEYSRPQEIPPNSTCAATPIARVKNKAIAQTAVIVRDGTVVSFG